MFGKILTKESMKSCSDKIVQLKEWTANADAVLIGAGAGLSTSAGLTYTGERFHKYFADFQDKYGIRDMYSGGFYPFPDLETYWGWWSRHIWYNRYVAETNDVYDKLLRLVENKNYFVITTNVDHQFQLHGFDKKRLFYMQGDYGLFQCSDGCHQVTYDNKAQVEQMIKSQHDMRIPSELIPKCPKCGRPMVTNLRCDDTFVQDEGWYMAKSRYEDFVSENKDGNILFLELGVGMNTPVWIKYPFWKMTVANEKARYICVNYGEAICPQEIATQSLCVDGDISLVIE